MLKTLKAYIGEYKKTAISAPIFIVFEVIFLSLIHIYPATDPVINILPDAYFLHCAVMILVLVILGSFICGLIYRRVQRKNVK